MVSLFEKIKISSVLVSKYRKKNIRKNSTFKGFLLRVNRYLKTGVNDLNGSTDRSSSGVFASVAVLYSIVAKFEFQVIRSLFISLSVYHRWYKFV